MLENDNTKRKTLAERIPGIGIICALLSASVLSVGIIFAKILSSNLHPTQVSLTRFYTQFLILLPMMQFNKNVDVTGPKGLKHLLWVRGFAGSTGMLFLYISLGKLSAGNAVTISYLRMVMVPFIARILLKESLTIFDGCFAAIAMVGVIFIAQPSFIFHVDGNEESVNAVGVLYAMISAAFTSLSIITIRKLGREPHPMLHIMYYAFCGSLTTTIILVAIGEFQYPCWSDLMMLFCLGIFGNLGQFFVTIALHNERAGTVVVLRSVQIVIVYVIQIVFLNDIPSYLSLIGATLVLSTSIGIGVRKAINVRKKKTEVT